MNELMRRRRALMEAKAGGRLPVEYQEVKYIQCDNNSSSVSYLNLPPAALPKDSLITIWIKQTATTSEDAGFLGRRDTSGAFELYYKDGVALAYGNGISNLVVTYGNTFDVVSATKINYGASEFLLMQYRPDRYFFSGRCFRAYVELGDSRLIDLIPCYRKSDGEIGMYDLISNTFFTNAGTGAFTKGSDV